MALRKSGSRWDSAGVAPWRQARHGWHGLQGCGHRGPCLKQGALALLASALSDSSRPVPSVLSLWWSCAPACVSMWVPVSASSQCYEVPMLSVTSHEACSDQSKPCLPVVLYDWPAGWLAVAVGGTASSAFALDPSADAWWRQEGARCESATE